MFPFLLPLLGLLGAAGGAAAGIAQAVKSGNEAKEAQERAYKATLERQDYERSRAEAFARGSVNIPEVNQGNGGIVPSSIPR